MKKKLLKVLKIFGISVGSVFVFQHPHPFGTVYGSSVWCNPQINTALAGHSRVIDFSGHTHFPMNDPRSINQSTYTAVGVGAMARFELDENYIPGQHPDGFIVHKYNVKITDESGKKLFSDNFIASYYLVNDDTTQGFTVPGDILSAGSTYTLTIRAEKCLSQIFRGKNGYLYCPINGFYALICIATIKEITRQPCYLFFSGSDLKSVDGYGVRECL